MPCHGVCVVRCGAFVTSLPLPECTCMYVSHLLRLLQINFEATRVLLAVRYIVDEELAFACPNEQSRSCQTSPRVRAVSSAVWVQPVAYLGPAMHVAGRMFAHGNDGVAGRKGNRGYGFTGSVAKFVGLDGSPKVSRDSIWNGSDFHSSTGENSNA